MVSKIFHKYFDIEYVIREVNIYEKEKLKIIFFLLISFLVLFNYYSGFSVGIQLGGLGVGNRRQLFLTLSFRLASLASLAASPYIDVIYPSLISLLPCSPSA